MRRRWNFEWMMRVRESSAERDERGGSSFCVISFQDKNINLLTIKTLLWNLDHWIKLTFARLNPSPWIKRVIITFFEKYPRYFLLRSQTSRTPSTVYLAKNIKLTRWLFVVKHFQILSLNFILRLKFISLAPKNILKLDSNLRRYIKSPIKIRRKTETVKF